VVTVFPTKVDWWLRPLLVLPLFGAGMSLYTGYTRHDPTTLLVSVAVLGTYGLIMGLIAWPIRYTVGPSGLEVRFGVVRRRFPWERVIAMELSTNPLSSPAMSLDRIAVHYRRDDGSTGQVLISPPDREAFLAECARTRAQR
jgi:hypothetical protein